MLGNLSEVNLNWKQVVQSNQVVLQKDGHREIELLYLNQEKSHERARSKETYQTPKALRQLSLKL